MRDNFLIFILVWLIDGIVFSMLSFWVHEMAHVVAGIVNGEKLRLLIVGPVGIKRTGKKLQVYFEKNLIYWGGVSATAPDKMEFVNKKSFRCKLLAAPVTTFVLGLAIMLVSIFAIDRANFTLWFCVLYAGLLFFANGLSTFLPIKTKGIKSDFWRYIELGKNDDKAHEEWEKVVSAYREAITDA